jgi:tRNA(Ile)-lysidine synthase
MRLSDRVLGAIRRHALLRPGGRVVVALSGGSDSVALLMLLRELQQQGALDVVAVAHLNHGLREAAGADEQFCRELAASMDIPFRSDLADVRGRAIRDGHSIEDAGRRARYELFTRVADEFDADAVATGHTRDDQAETFLLRLIRGAGPRGLGGIHPRAGRIIRPLLDITRDELRRYLSSTEQPYREDETNADVGIARNRVRHELLPLLQERFSARIVDVLAREAAIARLDEDRLQQEAIDLAGSIVLTKDGTREVDVPSLKALHPALAVRVARIALGELAPDGFVGFEDAQRLVELADRPPTRHDSVSLPGQYAERRGSVIVLSREPPRAFSNSFCVSLSIPGEALIDPPGWAILASPRPASPEAQSPGVAGSDPFSGEKCVQTQGLTPPLTVRSRRQGDWMRPFGMGGRRKKLQDLFVDAKIARDRRDSIPLVVDGTDRIVWVVGVAVAEDFRVTEPSQAVIFLKARRLGGKG